MKKLSFCVFCIFSSLVCHAENSKLTLSRALEIGLTQSPVVIRQKLENRKQLLEKEQVADDLSSRLYFTSRLQWIQPLSISINQQNDDHAFSLYYTKKLYDFGLNESLLEESSLERKILRLQNRLEKKQLRLTILQDYFNVLLSDLEFKVWNEAMSVAYIAMDRARDRMELKELSDIDYMEKQQAYQEVFLKRVEAEQKQRFSRSRLATSLSLAELPENLEDVNKVNWEKHIPDFEKLLSLLEQNNIDLRMLGEEVSLLRQKQKSNRKSFSPELNFEARISEYTKKTPGSYPAWMRFSLDYPLYEGDSEKLKNEQIQLQIKQRFQDIYQTKHELRDQLLQLWQQLELLKLKKKKADMNTEYRDYYLDRSRALYELELKSDLGDAMTRFTSAVLEQAQLKYQWILTWEKLSILTDQMQLSLINEKAKNEH